MRTLTSLILILTSAYIIASVQTVPAGFPPSGNGLWYSSPGDIWAKSWLPVGNGYLAAMLPGGTWGEPIQLNIESLWTGGPFADPSYNGGNKMANESDAMAQAMQQLRQQIFADPSGRIGDVNVLTSPQGAYGSYSSAGFFFASIRKNESIVNYSRWLDLDESILHTTWETNTSSYSRETFCSNPTRSCSQHLIINNTGSLADTSTPELVFAWGIADPASLPANVTCLDNSTISVRSYLSSPGMLYELIARVQTNSSSAQVNCLPILVSNNISSYTNATIVVHGASDVSFTWVGGSEYNISAGDAAHNFSFRGADPHQELLNLINKASPYPTGVSSSSQIYTATRTQHISDMKSVLGKFSLTLPFTSDAWKSPTDQLVTAYTVDQGNPYIEWLTFNYGRYMLASSTRSVLPANLQGKWATGLYPAWSADYHANINVQMCYWAAEVTNMGSSISQGLWDYMEYTWAPRGEYTAKVLYNTSRGWTTHNEMNIFGHTGMKGPNSASYADYPESNAWMMFHVYDRFSYDNDITWWKAQGWPLLKSVASFHLDKLIEDEHSKDGTLVVAPCNSPEQGTVTFGCSHQQTIIWQLFNAIEKGFAASGDNDHAFLAEIQAKKAKMDKGVHIGSWGQLQEWKVDMDSPTDLHRHLSHLVTLYPGYALALFNETLQNPAMTPKGPVNYTIEQVHEAARISLVHRGNGTGPDADAGWEKVWRAAQYAQLGDAENFYFELKYTFQRDFGLNLFSLYDPTNPYSIFQIDANLGYPAAVMNALLQCPDTADLSIPLTITLLPALPNAWANGSFTGARARAGVSVDLNWMNGKAMEAVLTVSNGAPQRGVKLVYAGKIVDQFITQGGMVKKYNLSNGDEDTFLGLEKF